MPPLLLLAEASMELVPKEIADHPAVVKHAKKRGKKPTEMLLDKNYHYWAMVERNLPNIEKRGRPDIVHTSLLFALDAPAVREGLIKVYVHTIDNKLIWFKQGLVIPRAYHRFVGLMEQLYKQRKIISPDGELLIKMEDKKLKEFFEQFYYDAVIVFTEKGKEMSIFETTELLLNYKAPLIIIGAFPHGDFSNIVYEKATHKIKLYPEVLMAWTVTGMILSTYGEKLRLTKHIKK